MQNDMVIDDYAISTWYAEHVEDDPYHAVNMTLVADRLSGYNLTDEEKISMPALMAGYCRLIDDACLIGFGKTEFEAIQNMFIACEIY